MLQMIKLQYEEAESFFFPQLYNIEGKTRLEPKYTGT